jgi:hypothetical protein
MDELWTVFQFLQNAEKPWTGDVGITATSSDHVQGQDELLE